MLGCTEMERRRFNLGAGRYKISSNSGLPFIIALQGVEESR